METLGAMPDLRRRKAAGALFQKEFSANSYVSKGNYAILLNMKNERSKQLTGMLSSTAASLLFGLSFMFVKQSVNSVSAFTLLSWRFLFAFLAMCVCALLGIFKLNLRGKDLKPLLLIAVFQPLLYYLAETWGIALTTSSESGTVMACVPIVTLILSGAILKEPPTRLQAVSIAVSVLGVLIIVLIKGLSASLNPLGYLLLAVAMLSDSLFVIFSRKAAAYTSTEKTFVMSAAGALVFTGCALAEHASAGTLREFALLPFTNSDFLFSLFYLSVVCSVIAFVLCNYGISIIGATRSASLAVLTTVVSVIAGVVFLGEPFSFAQGAATVLVLAGVYGANRMPKNAVPLESMAELEAMREKEEDA